jgi:hypothetical protein
MLDGRGHVERIMQMKNADHEIFVPKSEGKKLLAIYISRW